MFQESLREKQKTLFSLYYFSFNIFIRLINTILKNLPNNIAFSGLTEFVKLREE